MAIAARLRQIATSGTSTRIAITLQNVHPSVRGSMPNETTWARSSSSSGGEKSMTPVTNSTSMPVWSRRPRMSFQAIDRMGCDCTCSIQPWYASEVRVIQRGSIHS